MADRVYNALKDEIFAFRLIPGDKFSEGDVGTRLKASRTPVREALYRLQREGYVEVLFRSGWQVKPLDARQVDELYDLRIALERAAVDKLCALPEPLPEFTLHRELDFHCELVAAAGNRELTRIHGEVIDRLRFISCLVPPPRNHDVLVQAEHQKIISALQARKADDAGAQLIQHIRSIQRVAREATKALQGGQKIAPESA